MTQPEHTNFVLTLHGWYAKKRNVFCMETRPVPVPGTGKTIFV